MKAIFIEETLGTPKIEMNPDGSILIQGRSLPLDPVGFYNPILDWAKSCTASSINLDIRLDYLNTSSAKQLYTILFLFKENPNVKTFNVNWFYEEGDEDGYDTGREFESFIEIPFNFQEYAEVLD